MTEAQFQEIVKFFELKVALVDTLDNHPGEPWHLAHTALTGDYPDLTREELVLSVRALAHEQSRQSRLMFALTGIDRFLEDTIQTGIINLVLKMAAQVAKAGQAVTLPEGEVA